MMTLTNALVAFVALQHLGFLVLEMFLWTKPAGKKVFRLESDFAVKSAALAANQGLYNGFLAAGLIWSLLTAPEFSISLQAFFLVCVVVAGAFGAFTVNIRILFVQAVPAGIALFFLWLQK